MEQLAVRGTRAALPNLSLTDLEDVDTLGNRLGFLSDFRLVGAEPRSLEISGQHLVSGHISRLHAGRAKLVGLRMESVAFTGCDLFQAAFTGGKWSRVRFTDCKILSGQFSDLTVENVVFDQCRLDFAAFQAVTTKGPVIFRECSLEETWFTGCDLSKAAFDDCRMTGTCFERTLCKGTDLRGNDLSRIRGIPSLRQAAIEPAQVIQLGHALVADLDLRLPDD